MQKKSELSRDNNRETQIAKLTKERHLYDDCKIVNDGSQRRRSNNESPIKHTRLATTRIVVPRKTEMKKLVRCEPTKENKTTPSMKTIDDDQMRITQ